MSESPLVSVIVPVYGIDRYIGLCIESLLRQTYENIEILLVDDGSPDRCPEICDLYADKDSRVRVIHKPNGGLVSARKAGLARAHGDWIGYVDGDDWVEPDFLEGLLRVARKSDADMACTGFTRDLFETSAAFSNAIPPGTYEGDDLETLWSSMLSEGEFYRPGVFTYVWNKLFRRDIVAECQLNVDERISIGEDAAVTYPALLRCKKVVVTGSAAYHYRQREDSMLKSRSEVSEELRKLRYLCRYLSVWAKKLPHDTETRYHVRKQIVDYLLSLCVIRLGAWSAGGERAFFGADCYGKRVVVYSAGTFGQQLTSRMRESGFCQVVGWIDDDYWEYRRCCLNVDPVECVRDFEYDYLLIATTDSRVASRAVRRLEKYGVSREKTRTIAVPGSEREREALLAYFLKRS